MSKEDKRLILRLAYSSLWWIVSIVGICTYTSMGQAIAFFSTIVYLVVLYADAKIERLEEGNEKYRKTMLKLMQENMGKAYEYDPKQKNTGLYD